MLKQQQEQRQKLAIDVQQIQQIKLLEVSGEELADRIREELATNPASSYTELQGANASEEVRLTTLDGVLLRKMQCDTLGALRIGLEGITPGTYFLVVGSKAYRLLVSE